MAVLVCRVRASIFVSLGCCVLAAFGCGTAPQTTPEAEVDSGVAIVVAPQFEASPVFVRSLIIPQELEPGDSAAIAVEARDPIGGDANISYTWSAASGVFSRPNSPVTTYRCGAVGAQILNVTARDARGDVSRLALAVNCTAQ